ncbi:Fe-S oxidoreductase [Candidatus Magnetomorum sp. HK-1]|nr:Fe-S oxidoreductase [Candidatus Magnetomorum sp. HK-1]
MTQFKREAFAGKIAFINPNSRIKGLLPTSSPFGLMCLMGVCKSLSIPYAYIDAEAYSMDDTQILSAIHKADCDYIGMTLFSIMASKLFSLITRIKKETRAVIIVGGPLPTADTQWLMETCSEIDYAVSGEGELILPQLLLSIEQKSYVASIPGVSYWDGNNLVINNQNHQKSFSEIPDPDFETVDYRYYPGVSPVGAWPSVNILATRGCPYNCTFCCNPVWHRGVNLISVSTVIKWLNVLATQGIKHVYFSDDTININNDWFEELCGCMIKSGLSSKMLFRCQFRTDLTTRKQLESARKAGFWMIGYGVESGSQTILDYYKKKEKVEDSASAIEMTHAAGLHSLTNFIAGAPLDTVDTLLETSNFIRETNPTYASIQWLHPFIGAEIARDIIDKGILSKLQIREYDHTNPTIRTLTLSNSDLREVINYMRNDILIFKKSVMHRLKREQVFALQDWETDQNSHFIKYEVEQAESLVRENRFISKHIKERTMTDEILLFTSDIRLKIDEWYDSEVELRWSRPKFKLPFFLKDTKQYLEIYWAGMRSRINIKITLVGSDKDFSFQTRLRNPNWHKKVFTFPEKLSGLVWVNCLIEKPFFAPNDSRELGMAFKSIRFLGCQN